MIIKELDWLRLRKTICLLGEYNNWWSAKVLTETGEEFLSYVLPKTKSQAAFQLMTEICRKEHDQVIGPGRYHIFRLPQKLEEQIFLELKSRQGANNVLPEHELMDELLELSAEISISPSKGPLLIGNHDELQDRTSFQSIARHYHEAFKNNYRSYPYLT